MAIVVRSGVECSGFEWLGFKWRLLDGLWSGPKQAWRLLHLSLGICRGRRGYSHHHHHQHRYHYSHAKKPNNFQLTLSAFGHFRNSSMWPHRHQRHLLTAAATLCCLLAIIVQPALSDEPPILTSSSTPPSSAAVSAPGDLPQNLTVEAAATEALSDSSGKEVSPSLVKDFDRQWASLLTA